MIPLAMLLELLQASNLYSRWWEDVMDPDEHSDEQEEDQGDESAFGLYGVEDEAEGPCGGCQGTWPCVAARFRMRDERIDYLLGPVLLKAEMSFLSVRRFM